MLTLALPAVGTYGRTVWARIAKLVLLTLALGGLSQARAAEGKDQPRAVIVEARDLVTDAPVPDVRLQLSLPGGKTFSRSPMRRVRPASCYRRRRRAIPVRPRLARGFRPTSDPLGIQAERSDASRASPLSDGEGDDDGGRVVDEDKNPVAGATVVVSVRKKYPKSNQQIDMNFKSTKADANGVWSFANVPEAPDAVEMGGLSSSLPRRSCGVQVRSVHAVLGAS